MSFGVMCKVCGLPKQIGKSVEGNVGEAHREATSREVCVCDRSQQPLSTDEMLEEPLLKEEE